MSATRRYAGLLMLLLPIVLGTSCVRFRGPEDLRKDLSSTAGVELKKEMGVTVTRSGMWIARKAIKWSDDDDDIPSLKGVRRVEVGIYRVEGLREGRDERVALGLEDLPGWSPIVRIHEDGEDVFVLVDEDGERIKRMLIVVADQDEWVIVRIKGNLNRILEDAMRMAFENADRPDLYARSREERGLEPEQPLIDPEVESVVSSAGF